MDLSWTKNEDGFGATQAERVWWLMGGEYDLNRYRPPEADIVKDAWDGEPKCKRLWGKICELCEEFMDEQSAEECRYYFYELMDAFAIKIFGHCRILKKTPLSLDYIVYDLMVGNNTPEFYGWKDGGIVENIYETPEVEKLMDRFSAAWEGLDNRLKAPESEFDPDMVDIICAHTQMLELFSRQAFRYGQAIRI